MGTFFAPQRTDVTKCNSTYRCKSAKNKASFYVNLTTFRTQSVSKQKTGTLVQNSESVHWIKQIYFLVTIDISICLHFVFMHLKINKLQDKNT